ncbi:helix-turn-helix domain-containing protein [Mesorhizobium sp.]|uniref:helix-turn-helix domain-containing protein n=1 Tax=Mesorhizobium sp. TaxID=1871066 RepID=UPI00344D7303
MVRQIKNLKLRSSTQRVGCYALALSKRQGTPDRVVLPYEKMLIASELGIVRESFSRALSHLVDQASGSKARRSQFLTVLALPNAYPTRLSVGRMPMTSRSDWPQSWR